jgi:hypothetical protein
VQVEIPGDAVDGGDVAQHAQSAVTVVADAGPLIYPPGAGLLGAREVAAATWLVLEDAPASECCQMARE